MLLVRNIKLDLITKINNEETHEIGQYTTDQIIDLIDSCIPEFCDTEQYNKLKKLLYRYAQYYVFDY